MFELPVQGSDRTARNDSHSRSIESVTITCSGPAPDSRVSSVPHRTSIRALNTSWSNHVLMTTTQLSLRPFKISVSRAGVSASSLCRSQTSP